MLSYYKIILIAVFFVFFLLILKFVFDLRTSIDKETIFMRIQQAGYCEVADECVFIDKPCNIMDCGVAVNKKEAPGIKFLTDTYNFPYIERDCDIKCPVLIGTDCINNFCALITKK